MDSIRWVGDNRDLNCDGVDGTDADGDGVGLRRAVRTVIFQRRDGGDGAGDGIDQDCDAVDGVDADQEFCFNGQRRR